MGVGHSALALLCLLLTACYGSRGLVGDASVDPGPEPAVEVPEDVPLNPDTDGDTITDVDEGRYGPGGSDNTDADGTPDFMDLDSDCDGIGDDLEAGDGNLDTPPVDTDGDGVPDFRDPDSDADGLPDRYEELHGMDARSEDTDHDGVSDLIEVGGNTDPLDAETFPIAQRSCVFVMPYNDPAAPPAPPLDPEPEVEHLVVSTELQMADVFFALDSSGSMSSEIWNLRVSLRHTIVPGVLAEIPNAWFGVGRFEECTSRCRNNMVVVQEMTDNVTMVESSLEGWSTGCGSYEPYTQYLYALATGDLDPFLAWGGLSPVLWTCTPPGSVGWPCFRTHALPIVVQFGDEPFLEAINTCEPGYERAEAIDALNSIGAKYIGVDSGASQVDMTDIAVGTGSVDSGGLALLFEVMSDGSDVGAQVVEAIRILANRVPGEITARLRDDPADLVDATVEFIDFVEASAVGGYPDPSDPSMVCVSGLDVDDRYEPLDGRPDSFVDVLPGTPVCFDIHVKQNWTVPSTHEPQSFLVKVDVLGDGVTVLDTRDVYFLVPPLIEVYCGG